MSFIITHSGRHFSFSSMSARSIYFDDIATSLSNICRFTGHLDEFYSVAQHSVLVSYLVPPELAFEALMHDASEAYCSDISAPLKALLPDYKKMEKRIDEVIRRRFGLPLQESAEVKKADLIMLATERRDFGLDDGTPWSILKDIEPADFKVNPVSPKEARALFMKRFAEIPRPDHNFIGGAI